MCFDCAVSGMTSGFDSAPPKWSGNCRHGTSAMLRMKASRLSVAMLPTPNYFAGTAPGSQRLPKTGSLCGVGGSSQDPVEGGRISASTCASMTKGLLAFTACSSAPLKSSDFLTVIASTPQARAQAAKSGLYGVLLAP